ncbi:MAG TPA: hypothetical protein VGD89_07560, partial [Flavipsychrobacter sp.]
MLNKKIYNYLAAALLLGISATTATAQVADKILAVVGKNRIVLQSELEVQAAQAAQQAGQEASDKDKCGLLQQIILQKMLVEQAERDSLLVSEEEVEAALE